MAYLFISFIPLLFFHDWRLLWRLLLIFQELFPEPLSRFPTILHFNTTELIHTNNAKIKSIMNRQSKRGEISPAHGTSGRLLGPSPQASRVKVMHSIAFQYDDSVIDLIILQTYFTLLIPKYSFFRKPLTLHRLFQSIITISKSKILIRIPKEIVRQNDNQKHHK